MNTNKACVSFGSIHCVGGGQQFLERTLNKAQRAELQRLVESQKSNPINITLAQHGEKRLCGWTVFEEKTNGKYHRKGYTQRLLLESPIKFIKRLCDKANKLKEKFQGDIKEELGLKEFELNI